MTGTHEFKIANCFVAPQGHFFGNASAIPQSAKLVNIPDIHCVLRLGNCSRRCSTSSIPGVVAFVDFNSHGRLPRLVQRFLEITVTLNIP